MDFIIPGVVLAFMIGTVVTVKVGMANGMAKRPTFKEANEAYKNEKVCIAEHKSVDEKLACIPEIKATVIEIRAILKERDKK